MKNTITKVIGLMMIINYLLIAGSCASTEVVVQKSALVTEEAVCKLFTDNKEVFQKTSKIVKDIEISAQYKGMYFVYKNGEIVPTVHEEPIDYKIPDDAYKDMLEGFKLMHSILNKEYSEDEYALVMSYSDKDANEYFGESVDFSFYDNNIRLSYYLTYSENDLDSDSNMFKEIDNNWYYWSWGEV